jgi:diacylglycerol kinase (ATP)
MKPQEGYIAYIINPHAGSGRMKKYEQHFRDYLTSRNFDVRVRETTSLEHTCEQANDAAIDYDCKLVVAAGGDGTVREVAHGLEGSDKPLFIVPCGTENLLADELGFDGRFETIIRTFEVANVRPLDLGSANGRCFTSIAGFGFDGLVVKRVDQIRQGHINHLTYFWPLWHTFWDYKFDPMKVVVDGQEIFNGRGLVFVGNISRYALGLQILHSANFSDGLLDICIYKCASKPRLIKHSIATIFKQHTFGSDVIYRQGREITVSSDCEDIQTEIDGDPGPPLPVNIRMIPKAVNVMVLEGARPAGIRARLRRALRKGIFFRNNCV